jgi:hypothetical protein
VTDRFEQDDEVEDALARMAAFDAQQAAIEAAEAGGAQPEVPQLSVEAQDAMVAMAAAAARGSVEPAPSRTSATVAWVGGALALAASVLLWRVLTDAPAPEPAIARSLPAARVQLGGTARTLGDAPPARPYGLGDSFAIEVVFDTPPPGPVAAMLSATDAEGTRRSLPLERYDRPGVVGFRGQVADVLPPGLWTLQLRYGDPQRCTEARPEDCEALEAQIEILGS